MKDPHLTDSENITRLEARIKLLEARAQKAYDIYINGASPEKTERAMNALAFVLENK